jgi:hypothetical protein
MPKSTTNASRKKKGNLNFKSTVKHDKSCIETVKETKLMHPNLKNNKFSHLILDRSPRELFKLNSNKNKIIYQTQAKLPEFTTQCQSTNSKKSLLQTFPESLVTMNKEILQSKISALSSQRVTTKSAPKIGLQKLNT